MPEENQSAKSVLRKIGTAKISTAKKSGAEKNRALKKN